MTTLGEAYPPLGVRISSGDLELRLPTDADLPALIELAAGGIHDADTMPFFVPWTRADKPELASGFVENNAASRRMTPAKWSLNFSVFEDGVPVGRQTLSGKDFLITRTVSTGSWLGLEHHGRGLGTRMRALALEFAFDQLGADFATSSAFDDNPASVAVSRTLGYRDNGRVPAAREGALVWDCQLLLVKDDFVRPEAVVAYEGVEAFRRFIGLN